MIGEEPMAYSSIYNVNTSLKYKVYLDDEVVRTNVSPHHVDSIIYELQNDGVNIVDEFWDEKTLEVRLISTGSLDDEDDESWIEIDL